MDASKTPEPEIRAELILGSGQIPEFVQGRARKHYKIKLLVDNVPMGTDQVLLELDPTYKNPIREAKRNSGFVVDITSYGDYVVNAQVPGGRFVQTVQKKLSEALLKSYANTTNAAVRAAIDDIMGA